MKGLFLLLLPHCLNGLHICPTFPYCALQPSGLWSSLPILFKPPVNVAPVLRVTPEPMPRSSSSCWFPNTYCRPSPSNLVLTGEAKTAADCQEECGDTQGCEFFTFLRHRGSPQCSLLSSCTRANRCSVGESCASGPPRCSCNSLDRSSQTREEGVRYALWECDGDINPYDSDIPSGTKCTTTCPAWRGLEDEPLVLESTCVEGSQWTSTRPSDSDLPVLRVSPYATTIYNTPDMDDMVCGCQNVGPFDYNPNNEELAELVCRGGQPKDFDAPGGWSFTTTDRCDLFCNQEPVVSVYCDGTSWVGEPKKGIWCYTSPENPGPRDEDLTAPESEISDEETENEGYDDCTYVRREACDGNSIMDIELDQEECIDRCKSVVDCNCVTWLHNGEAQAQCRLETGTTASDRGTDIFSAVTMTKCNVAP